MSNFGKFPKINFTIFFKSSYFQFFFSFISKPFLISFQKNFNHFDFSIKTIHPIKSNVMACMLNTCCYLMMYFKLMKNYFPIFHVHKNFNLNHFGFVLKEAIFRVLQSTPTRHLQAQD